MKTFLLTMLLALQVLCVPCLHGQSFKWVQTMNNFLPAYTTVIDHQHDIISAGKYNHTIRIGTDSFTASSGNQNAYLVKHDSSGNVIWSVNIPTTGSSTYITPSAIAVDANDNIYVAGTVAAHSIEYTSTDSTVYKINYGCFVAKYNSTGHFVSSLPIYGIVNCNALTIDASGNVIFGGYFSDSANFSGVALPSDGAVFDLFLAKYDATGSPAWVKRGTSLAMISSYGGIQHITTDGSDNIYATGYMPGDFLYGTDTIHNTLLNTQALVAKFDKNGLMQWHAMEGAYGRSNQGLSIALDAKGNVYAGGEYNDSVGFNAKPFIAKYTNAGTKQWLKTFKGQTLDGVNNIVIDAKGNPYITGNYPDSIRFDTTLLTCSRNSAFIAKLDSNGNTLNAQTLHGRAYIYGMGLDKNTGNIAVSGLTYSPDTFGTIPINLTSSMSAYVAYLFNPVPSGVVSIPHTSQYTIYPNPATNTLYIKNAIPNSIVNIYNVSGQVVYFGKLSTSQQAINISGLVSGMYFVKMITPNGVAQTKSFVKE